jgi:hypothetical protein
MNNTILSNAKSMTVSAMGGKLRTGYSLEIVYEDGRKAHSYYIGKDLTESCELANRAAHALKFKGAISIK